MNNLKCQIQSHNNDKVVAVCMDNQCKNQQRLCYLQCLFNLHNTHQNKTIQVDRMSEFIQQESQKQSSESLSYGQQQVIKGLENLWNLVDSFQKIIKERIETLKQQNLQEYLKKNCSNYWGFRYWNQLLDGMLKFVEVDNCIINKTTSKEGQLNDIDKEQIKIIKQSEVSLQTMINQIVQAQINDVRIQQKIRKLVLIEIPQPQIQKNINQPIAPPQMIHQTPIQQNVGKLCFKPDRKHTGITIIDECTIKLSVCNYCYSMAFANEGFDPNEQSYQFAFNIQKIVRWVAVGWIAVGVGNDEGNNVPFYEFTKYDQLGHGQYLNSYDQQTYHHTDSEMNDKQKGLKFNDGDTIQLQYDHKTKLLEFRRQSAHDTVVKMLITDMTKRLYPCAALYFGGDQVQLVKY